MFDRNEAKAMKTRNFVVGFFMAAALMLQLPLLSVAQDQGPPPGQVDAQPQDPQYQGQGQPPDQGQDQAQDPPGRVGRLNYSEGSVSFQPGGTGDWVQAVQNRPLTTGDNLWADKDSRAELHVGSTALRMSSETSITFLDLDDQTTQIKLSQGSLMLKVRHLDDGDLFEVDTPNLAFTIQRIGEYRVDVNSAGDETLTTVWRGRGEVTGGGESYVVVAGQQAVFDGTDQLNHQINQLPAADDFDNWAFARDQQEDASQSVNYISPEMTGAEDLDEYGNWTYAADYGPVWRPTGVPVGWAPYRYGHWAWVGPWGWTWVEDEPWGFAPFHYGRWAFYGGGWCWVPGPVVIRPLYAPAMVAFVGGGPAFGVGVAWFPLAPREVYVPWYRTSRGYVNNVNVMNTRVNVTQVTNVYNTTIINNNNTVTRINYANQRVPSAITAVSHDTFVNARPVARNIAQVDTQKLASAPITYREPARPERASVVGSGAPSRVKPPTPIMNRQVVATRNPTPPRPEFNGSPAQNARPTQNARPAPNVRAEAPASTPHPATLEEQGRPPVTERPQQPSAQQRPQNEARPPQPAPQARSVPQPSPTYQRGSAPAREPNPEVRQAPPVQNRPEFQRNEEQKFNTWQQQRQTSAPRSAPRPAPTHAEPARPPHR
jgi:flagellar hook-associated protein FlgK